MGGDSDRSTDSAIVFSDFRLDLRAGHLTRARDAIPLRPKTWAVLVYLAEHPGKLVSKEELLDAVWPDVAVTPDTLTKSIGELRLALGDDAKVPRYIETAHRRGFRFIAEVRASETGDRVGASDEAAQDGEDDGSGLFVGRQPELRRLEELLRKVHRGERQLGFVTGAAGIGKTSLIEAFLASPAVRRAAVDTRVGRGACIEQHGSREAYMPILEALGRLARDRDPDKLAALLRRTAPSWLAQLPWMIGDEHEDARRAQHAANPDRMLREFVELAEALTGDATVILLLEDLHWSDPSTVDLLAALAQRREPARLLVIGTYRPADLVVTGHPLSPVAHMLKARRRSVELPLHELSEANVQSYLDRRFPQSEFPRELAPLLHDHTDGNPLFLAGVVDHMLARGLILETDPGWSLSGPLDRIDLGVPDHIGEMVQAQIDLLHPLDRQLLEAAAVGGMHVAVPAIAGVLGADSTGVELRCETLARARRFLRPAGIVEWPDGTVTRRYAFVHELYRQVLYAGIPDQQRMTLHQRIGETVETSYGDRAAEVAPTLAVHFEKSRDHLRAIAYLTMAGARARQRCANREALAYLEPALARVARVEDQNLRRPLEVVARIILGACLADLHGYASEAVRENYERADALCSEGVSAADRFEVAYALSHFHAARGDAAADAVGKKLDRLADKVGTPDARLRADSALVKMALVAGRFDEAEKRMQAMSSPESLSIRDSRAEFGPDPVIDAEAHYAVALWFMGYPERARARSRAAIDAARASGQFFAQAAATCMGGALELFCGDTSAALALAQDAVDLCGQQSLAFWGAIASAVKGYAWVLRGQTQDGLAELVRAQDALRATGSTVFSTHILAFLAETHRRDGNLAEALAAAERGLALAETRLDRSFRAELWRLKGELLSAAASGESGRESPGSKSELAEAERCLLTGLEIARESQAKSLELRAAASLARAWQGRGRRKEAYELLSGVCEWFGRVDGNPEVDDARSLLGELSGGRGVQSRSAARKVSGSPRISSKLPKTFQT